MVDDLLVERRRSHRYWHLAAYLAAAGLLFLLLRWLAPALMPIMAAMAIAYLLNPLVERLARRGVPRTGAVFLILLGFTIVVLAIVAVMIPLVARDVDRFRGDLPVLIARLSAWLHANFSVEIPDTSREILAQGADSFRAFFLGAEKSFLLNVGKALGGVLLFLGRFLEVLLVPVFAFYFLKEWKTITGGIERLIPPRHRHTTLDVLREIDRVVSSWVRGQLTVVAILAVLYPVGLSLSGIQLAVPIGVLAGLLAFIPYVGAAVGLVLATLMALLGWSGPGPLIGVGATFLVLNLVEGFLLTPRLVGKKVGIGELGALVAALAGGKLLGFVGVMLAIPLVAAIAVVVRRLVRYYNDSEFYRRGAHE